LEKNNASTWNKVVLTDSSGYWVGDILSAGLQGDDSLNYYLEAKSANGKTATKPINASKGAYYQMRLKYITGEEDLLVTSKNHLFNAYPNPAKETVTINFKLVETEDVKLQIWDINGRLVINNDLGQQTAGMHGSEINVSELPSGIYVYQLWLNNAPVMSKKLIIGN
jgi:hypothetical protein